MLVIVGTYILEYYPLFTVIPMAVSALLYAIYIFNTPAYQLDKIKIAYNVVNISATLVGVFAFFFSRYYEKNIMENMEAIMRSDECIDFFQIMPNAMKYLEEFGEGNINNLFYLLVLPYTFGILVANMCIEKKERKADKKRKEILKNIYFLDMCNKEKIIELKKEYLYWGGNLLECDTYIQIGKMYREQNGKEELME